MPREDPDLALVRALQAGEDQAFDALMDRYRKGIFRFIFRRIPNEADAVDLTQEVFVRAYFHIGKFRPTAKFITWLYHIARNLCRDYSRSRAYRHSWQTISADADENEEQTQLLVNQYGPDRQTQDRELLRAVEKAINELPQDPRNLLILTALEGHSHAEAAELLGISAKAVEARVYRARRLLLKKIGKMGF
jgi:RNA polymerase sigma-70 factor (ECF subfamily)